METISTEAQVRLLKELLQSDFPHMRIEHFAEAYQGAFQSCTEADPNSAEKKAWHNTMMAIHFVAIIRFDIHDWFDAIGQKPKHSNIKFS